jgi:hypothetical protein
MKIIQVSLASFLLLASTLPARADFKYTETSQMTGGSMLGMMKFASKFARGDAKKQEKDMLKPTSTTHYVTVPKDVKYPPGLHGDQLQTHHASFTKEWWTLTSFEKIARVTRLNLDTVTNHVNAMVKADY